MCGIERSASVALISVRVGFACRRIIKNPPIGGFFRGYGTGLISEGPEGSNVQPIVVLGYTSTQSYLA